MAKKKKHWLWPTAAPEHIKVFTIFRRDGCSSLAPFFLQGLSTQRRTGGAVMDGGILLSWFLVGLAFLSAYVLFGKATWSSPKFNLPPGPRGVPILGNLLIFMSQAPHQELSRLAQLHGPLFSIRLGSKAAIVVSSPGLAKEVFTTHDRTFADRPKVGARDHLLYGEYQLSYSCYNAFHKTMRRVLVVELLSSRRLQHFEGVRTQELSSMTRSMWEQSDNNSGVVEVNFKSSMSSLTMNVMTRMIMSQSFFTYGQEQACNENSAAAAEFKHLFDDILRLQVLPLLEDYVPYLSFLDRVKNYKADMHNVHKRMDVFLDKIIDAHKPGPTENQGSLELKHNADFIDVLLSLPGRDGAKTPTNDMIKGLLLDAIVAGTDTSSITVEWAMSELLRHPDVMKKAQQELDTVVGKNRLVTESDLPRLPLLLNIVKETFRLHPVVPLLVPHESVEYCQLVGYDIPARTRLIVNVWAIGRSPEVWDNPLSFTPERFQDRDIDVRGKHFELLPFGTGRRGCPAMALGITMVQYPLARLLQSFDWSLPNGQKPEKVDMSEAFGLTAPRAKHLVAIASPRLSPQMF